MQTRLEPFTSHPLLRDSQLFTAQLISQQLSSGWSKYNYQQTDGHL